MMSNLTVSNLTVVGATYGSTCIKDAGNSYTYFGNLTNSGVATITQPDITSLSGRDVFFYKVRITYGIITIDDWDDSSKVLTQFLTDTTSTPI